MNPVTLHLIHWYGLALFALLLSILALFPNLTLWLWQWASPLPTVFLPITMTNYTLRYGPLSGQRLDAVTDLSALVLYRAQCPNITPGEYKAVGQRIRELHQQNVQRTLRNVQVNPR